MSKDAVIQLMDHGVLVEGQFIADTNLHNDDVCGYDIGEYRMTRTYAVGDVDETEVKVAYRMYILYYADGTTVIDEVDYHYETDVSGIDLTKLFGRTFDPIDELRALVGVN